MTETLMMVLVCLSFMVVSLALAFSLAMNAYLDWYEQKVAIDYGIEIITARNSKQEKQDDDPID
ncbi:hypothetical protein N8381_00760 [Oceanospirillaceae bacterium]|jgi:hypothetical protein|nr:hypothetical protein [Oceanospirillaceae bacterium]